MGFTLCRHDDFYCCLSIHTQARGQSNVLVMHVCVCVYACLLCVYACVCLLLNSRTARSATLKIGFRMPAVRFITASNINSNNNPGITATTTRKLQQHYLLKQQQQQQQQLTGSKPGQAASSPQHFRHGLNFLMLDSWIRAEKVPLMPSDVFNDVDIFRLAASRHAAAYFAPH